MFSHRLLHSVSYSGTWGQANLPLESFIDKAAALGYDGVMLMAKRPHASPLYLDGYARAALRDRIQQRGLKSVCLAGYTNFTADMEHGEVPHREIQTLYVETLAKLASEIGANLIRVFTGYQNSASSYLAQWNLIAGALKECARRASQYGVTIGVQNHHDIGVGWETLGDLLAAIHEPNCKALFDAWAPALHGLSGADLRKAARQMAPLMAHTTVADYQLRPRYRYDAAVINYTPETPYAQAVPMGEGFIDYRSFFTGLREGGFTGSVAYEMCSPLLGGGSEENLDRYAARFLAYLRESPAA